MSGGRVAARGGGAKDPGGAKDYGGTLDIGNPARHRFGRELPPRLLGFAMNLPTLITLALVLAYPIYYAGYLSLHRVTLIQLRTGNFPFIGFANYEKVLDDPLFLLSLGNTLIFTAFTVIVEVVAAVAIAILINQQDIWTSRITRFLILLPYAVPPIAKR